jgi:hypothetical protein
MNENEERQEYDAVEEWAQNRPKAEVHARLDELMRTNAYARKKLSQRVYGDTEECEHDSVVLDHTGYNRTGSSNWEHDYTGPQMNRSGMVDIALQSQIDHNGLEPGYDYPDGKSDEDN